MLDKFLNFREYAIPTFVNLRILMYLDTHFVSTVCRIHTFSKIASISRNSRLNERLHYSSNAQILYWNLIGQNRLFQRKFWPTSSTTSECSNVGHKDLNLTSLLEASSCPQIKGQKTARWSYADKKKMAFLLNDFLHAFQYNITICLNSIFFQPNECLVPPTSMKSTVGQKAILMTVLYPPIFNCSRTRWTYSLLF